MTSAPASASLRHRRPHAIGEAIVEGRPALVIRDEDREAVTDALAELLIADLKEDTMEAPECRW